MQPLESPDSHHYSSAVGWLGLGNAAEAKAELAQVSSAQHQHPDVLEVRWTICAAEADWEAGLEAARALVRTAPDRAAGWVSQAYALRRTHNGGLQQAWDALLPAVDRFPRDAIIPFNLACYACQMQQLETALVWLTRAAQIGGSARILELALKEPDLQPLWDDFRKRGLG